MTVKEERDLQGRPVHYTNTNTDGDWECSCGFVTGKGPEAAAHDVLGPITEPPSLDELQDAIEDIVLVAKSEGHEEGVAFALLQMRNRAGMLDAEAAKIDVMTNTEAYLGVTAAARAMRDLATDLEDET